MELFISLWPAILVSAVGVWIASAVIWMALPHHKNDFSSLPDEPAFSAYVKGAGIKPGRYMFPFYGSNKECNSAEAKQRWKDGPVGTITVFGQMGMGKNMLLTVLVYLVISIFIAYIAALALPAGQPFEKVFRVTGACGILAYCFSFLPNGIWFQAGFRSMFNCFVDGIVFGLITGLSFGLLWPKGAMAAAKVATLITP